MDKRDNAPRSESASLDTLVLRDQSASIAPKKGVLESEEATRKQAQAKDFTHALSSALYAEAIRSDGKEERSRSAPQKYERKSLRRAYGRSMDCAGLKVQDADGSLRTTYCNSRWCVVCNRIRMAKGIRTYSGWLQSIGEDAFFVTLTSENCTEPELRKTLQRNILDFKSCVRSIRRTDGEHFEAIRKTEVTYNRGADTYHPHYHVIVNGELQAYLLLSYWMKRSHRKVDRSAQDVQPLTPGGLKEVMKYSTKSITKTEEGDRGVHTRSLHVIYTAMKGMKTLQPYGFRLKDFPVIEDEGEEMDLINTTVAFKRIGEAVNWTWIPDYAEWVDTESGECLSGYVRPEQLDTIISRMKGVEPQPPYPLNDDTVN